jgi:hypothetical protein
MAEKSLVNDDADTFGAPAAAELLAVVVELAAALEDVLELELDELPQAATAKLAVTASAAKSDLLLSKCTSTSLSSVRDSGCGPRPADRTAALAGKRTVALDAMGADVNKALTSGRRA